MSPIASELFHEPMPVTRPIVHTQETIRAEMHAILAEARPATVSPWTPRKLRSHTAGFLKIAGWLENGEGDQLMSELKAKIDRLEASADQVAPNWRRIWGIAA